MHLATVHCVCVCVHMHAQCVPVLSRNFVTLWTIARQDPLFVEFFQARILEWVAISYSREPSWPGDQTCISCVSALAGGFFTTEPQEVQLSNWIVLKSQIMDLQNPGDQGFII